MDRCFPRSRVSGFSKKMNFESSCETTKNLSHAKPQSRKDAKEITNIMFYLGALASLRENKQFLFRSDRTLAADLLNINDKKLIKICLYMSMLIEP